MSRRRCCTCPFARAIAIASVAYQPLLNCFCHPWVSRRCGAAMATETNRLFCLSRHTPVGPVCCALLQNAAPRRNCLEPCFALVDENTVLGRLRIRPPGADRAAPWSLSFSAFYSVYPCRHAAALFPLLLLESVASSSPHPQSYASPMFLQSNSAFLSRLFTMLWTKQPHIAAAVRDET